MDVYSKYLALYNKAGAEKRDEIIRTIRQKIRDGRISTNNKKAFQNLIKQHYKPTSAPPNYGFKRKQINGVHNWTSYGYRNIQDLKRKGRLQESWHGFGPRSKKFRSVREKNARQVNQRVATFMQQKAHKSPTLPRYIPNLTTLYRGMHGPLATKIMKDGFLDDKGYIAFSRSMPIARSFASKLWFIKGIVLVLRTKDVPPGTPWIFFNKVERGKKLPTQSIFNDDSINLKGHRRRTNMAPSVLDEGEVLLPPGRIVLKRKYTKQEALNTLKIKPKFSMPVPHVYEVAYIPDKLAASTGGHYIFPQPAKKRKVDWSINPPSSPRWKND
jgi:hypothetical protein